MSVDVSAMLASANQAYQAHRMGDCERICSSLLAQDPSCRAATVLLGMVALERLQPTRAIAAFESVLADDPDNSQACQWIARAHRQAGDLVSALRWAAKCCELTPKKAVAIHFLGQCQYDIGDYRLAETSFRRALILDSRVPAIHHSLALTLRATGRDTEAAEALIEALRLDPNSLPALVSLRDLLIDIGDHVGATVCARTIVNLQPRSVEANLWLARCLATGNNTLESEQYVDLAIELGPKTGQEFALLGRALQVRGQTNAANEHFQKSIELSPRQGAAYLALVSNRRVTRADAPLITTLENLVNDPSLPAHVRDQLHYALGKACEDLEDYEPAMAHFDDANRIRGEMKSGRNLLKRQVDEAFEWTLRRFRRPDGFSGCVQGSRSERPIFVVGMIRSGTTLVEQILSCHPQIGAGGEQAFWLNQLAGAVRSDSDPVNADWIESVVGPYEEILDAVAPGKEKVVDKMPMNHRALGLINLAFPKAKIIHVHRHPVDTCLSVYTTPNNAHLDWIHSKTGIVQEYKNYLEITSFWDSVLPPESVLHVKYEDLVRDPDRVTRALIAFCGVKWDDVCLRPQDNPRRVSTPSQWQVRQPIFQTSIERWRRYDGHLGAFEELLGTVSKP